ncbi:MAG: M15 family metallopeptidase [Bacilli bacterium]|nr:M15 family metallopeptidase [Bacilli bacterium]
MNEEKSKKALIFTIISIIIVLAVGISIALYMKDKNYKSTYDYQLKEIGYNEQEIINIKKLPKDKINIILNHEYDKNMINLIQKQYFLEKNIDRYLTYLKINSDKDLDDVIAIVNVKADQEWYTNITNTDLTYNDTLLTNKFYQLQSDYEPNDLKDISNIYSYGENQKLRNDAFNAFIQMFKDAKKENITLIINSSYRSYQEQEKIYNKYVARYGEEEAKKKAAKPGHSEHQTGLAADIQTYNSNQDNFEETDAFRWLQNNAYKYGFILRYPKDKEYLTGYSYESWHYRYVGLEIAQYIHENNITFDEYYAFFLEK